MTWSIGFNFRSTSGFVTDGTGETWVNPSVTYPTTRTVNGISVTFGWEDTASLSGQDRNASVDRRLAGSNADGLSGKRFRVDLPATGQYTAHMAMGDYNGPQTVTWNVEDTTTILFTKNGTTSGAQRWFDATGVERDATTWPSSNAAATWTFSTTICRVQTGTGTNSTSCLNHFSLTQVVPASTITVTAPAAYQDFQQSSGTASIPISGTYTTTSSTPTGIEASFNGGAYSTIVASPSGGTFSGTLTGQAAGQGTLTVRFVNDTTVNTTIANVGIGDVFGCAGQSNMSGRGTNNQSYSGSFNPGNFRLDDAWKNANDPTGSLSGDAGSWLPPLTTQYMASQSGVCGLVCGAKGSTGLVGGANVVWPKGQSQYTAFANEITASGVNSLKAILWFQGEDDAGAGVSRSAYSSALTTLIGNFASDFFSAKTLIVQIGDQAAISNATFLDNIRLAQQDVWDAGGNAMEGPCLWDCDLTANSGDGIHFKTDALLALVAARTWVCLSKYLYGGTRLNPKISSAVLNAARTQITVTFNQTLTTGLTLSTGCWAVSDNGSAATVSAVADGASSTQVVLTLSGALSGPAGTCTLNLGQGRTGVGTTPPRSASVTLPSGATTYLIPRVVVGQSVSEFSAANHNNLLLLGVG